MVDEGVQQLQKTILVCSGCACGLFFPPPSPTPSTPHPTPRHLPPQILTPLQMGQLLLAYFPIFPDCATVVAAIANQGAKLYPRCRDALQLIRRVQHSIVEVQQKLD